MSKNAKLVEISLFFFVFVFLRVFLFLRWLSVQSEQGAKAVCVCV